MSKKSREYKKGCKMINRILPESRCMFPKKSQSLRGYRAKMREFKRFLKNESKEVD